jgi:hypothetical protein
VLVGWLALQDESSCGDVGVKRGCRHEEPQVA